MNNIFPQTFFSSAAIPGWASVSRTGKVESGGRKWRRKAHNLGWYALFKVRLLCTQICTNSLPQVFYRLQTPWRNTFHFVNKPLLSWSFYWNKSKYTKPEILNKNSPTGAGKFHQKPGIKVLLNSNKHSSACSPSSTCQYMNNHMYKIPATYHEQHTHPKELLHGQYGDYQKQNLNRYGKQEREVRTSDV